VGRLLAGVLALLCVSCSATAPDRTSDRPDPEVVAVGAFDFPESLLLAELYAQSLESAGVPVERLGSLGSRETLVPALQQGLVDVVPEYLGSSLEFLRDGIASAPSEADLRQAFAERGVTVLAPSRGQNQNAIAVLRATADRHGLQDVSDLREVAPAMVFGGPPECPERPRCLLGLTETYALRFAEFIPLPGPGAVAAALLAEEIDVGLVFSTAPQLGDQDLVLLADDRGLQPPENVVPVIRTEALAAHPDARAALERVSAALTTTQLMRLNRLVELDGRSVHDVAEGFLAVSGGS
jgi:osmoprotectant transport system substrate-binding protein